MRASVRGHQIVESLRKAKQDFGDPYPKKFGGAAAIEILRAAFSEEGIMTSRRDVFVKEFSSEIDLLVPRKDAAPWLELLYEPREVVVAIEVKKTGSYGERGRDKIKDDFARLDKLGVKCAYVTFEDRENYRWRPTEKFLGFRCFALAWHKITDGPLVPTKDGENWEALVSFLQKAIAAK
ncbi:MAG: hypothetical protein L7F78_15060 [Syntrophales bacterium LBB04]|nr:hypothetical protein [Syntrophales bacterium LBB04]